jgi:hypothetical protein
LIPEQIPPAIRSALKTSLRLEAGPAAADAPSSADLRWAAGVMETAYSAVKGDDSWKALLGFYDGLSQPQRRLKAGLDARFDVLQNLRWDLNRTRIIADSSVLQAEYSRLGDYWQMSNIHLFRGNGYFYQADFRRAESEYREMLRWAETTASPELRCKALAALTAAYSSQIRPEQEQACLRDLRQLARTYKLEYWDAFTSVASALLHVQLNQREKSIKELSAGLRFASRKRDSAALETLFENLPSNRACRR